MIDATTMRQQFSALFWWLAFGMIVVGLLPYLLKRPPELWIEAGIGTNLLALAWVLVWHMIGRSFPTPAIQCCLLGLLPLVAWSQYVQTDILRELDIAPLGLMVTGNVPTFALAALMGWPGALLGLGGSVLLLGQGAELPQRIIGTAILGTAAVLGSLFYRLLGALERAQQQLADLALLDSLTKLGNRHSLGEDYRHFQRISRQRNLPCLLSSWDVNDLKKINDRDGHAAGDAYLLRFVEALRGAVRASDGLYRVGGDEFIAIHPGLSDGEKILQRVHAEFATVACGWVAVTDQDLETALAQADLLLYAHKRAMKANAKTPERQEEAPETMSDTSNESTIETVKSKTIETIGNINTSGVVQS
jgi:diguanylate cyclase (GGDEF)-like protein